MPHYNTAQTERVNRRARTLGRTLRPSDFAIQRGPVLDIRVLGQQYWNIAIWRNGKIILSQSGRFYLQQGVALISVKPNAYATAHLRAMLAAHDTLTEARRVAIS